jgi:NhaA family Na+:H+ antiporter
VGGTHTTPPWAWLPARRLAVALQRPVERFLHIEAASGFVLIGAAAVALVWANSPWGGTYDALWHTPFRIGIGEWTMERSLHFWINDLFMAVFFLVVGLEIKREIVDGALSDVKRAALPVAAAVGGMLVPATIYAATNVSGPGGEGWGVPMATDIAFAVGMLTLLGKRVPPALRVLLLAFAIIDDIGAILVIAFFYSSGFAVQGLLLALAGLGLGWLLLKMGVRPGVAPIPFLLAWAGLYMAGIHPTIAGVMIGLLAPARAWYGREGFLTTARQALDQFDERAAAGRSDHELIEPLQRIAVAQREAIAPAVRLEVLLHPWTAFGVMPLFALANAGVRLGGVDFTTPGGVAVLGGVALGLLLGKTVGVLGFSWLAVKLRLCALPRGVNWRGMTVVGLAGAIGFTMAIFIAELAFRDPDLLALAKLGVLGATAVAAVLVVVGGRLLLPTEQPAALSGMTESSVESSTEIWVGAGAVSEGAPASRYSPSESR